MSTTYGGSNEQQDGLESVRPIEETNQTSAVVTNTPQRPPLLPSYTQVLRDTAATSNSTTTTTATTSPETQHQTSSNGATRSDNNSNDTHVPTIITTQHNDPVRLRRSQSFSSWRFSQAGSTNNATSYPNSLPSSRRASLDAGMATVNNSSSHLLLSQPYILRSPYNPYPDPGLPPPDNLHLHAPQARARQASLGRIASTSRRDVGSTNQRVGTLNVDTTNATQSNTRNNNRQIPLMSTWSFTRHRSNDSGLEGAIYASENPYRAEIKRMQTRVVQCRRLLILPILIFIVLCVSASGFKSFFLPVPILIIFINAFMMLYILRRKRAEKQANLWELRMARQRDEMHGQLESRLMSEATRQLDANNLHYQEDMDGDEALLAGFPIRPPPTYDQAKRVPPPHNEAIREYEHAVALALSRIGTPQPSTADLHARPSVDVHSIGASTSASNYYDADSMELTPVIPSSSVTITIEEQAIDESASSEPDIAHSSEENITVTIVDNATTTVTTTALSH
ncbi:hypothetical protein BDF19DRAFT_411844 [Syncephalis fuscata]|nr:hypothetical protein BDF19DRAFT_411844 [Syncephalis fuscata]